MKMPAWLQGGSESVYEPAPGVRNRKFRVHFVDRTLSAIVGTLGAFFLSDCYVREPGLLQGIEARLKLLGVLGLIVCASLIHSIPCLYVLYGSTLMLAVLSKIPASFFLRRIWLILPFFLGAVALPATLNLFTPGEIFFTLFTLDRPYQAGPYSIPRDISLTRQGISAALLLVGRVATSLSFVLLLILTTPWASLLKALRSLLVPQIYVQTLGMTLRYLLLLARAVQDMCLAKKSRTVRARRAAEEQRWVAAQLGSLFKWSMQLSSEVYRSMVARGYNGEARALTSCPPRMRDYAWLTFCAGASGILLYLGR